MHRQRGLGTLGVLLVVALGGFLVISAAQLFPYYLEFFAIKRALVATVQSDESKNATVVDLRKALGRRFEVDNVKAITPADVDIAKSGGNPVMSVSYSAKVHLFANVNACIEFDATSGPK